MIYRVFLYDSKYTAWQEMKELIEYDTRRKINEELTTGPFIFLRILITNQLERDAENEYSATKN